MLFGSDVQSCGNPSVSLAGVDFTSDGRPELTTLWENLFQENRGERTDRHGADTHEFIQRDHLPAASWGK